MSPLSLKQKKAIWRSQTTRSPAVEVPYVAIPFRRPESALKKLAEQRRELASVRSRLAQVLPTELAPSLSQQELDKIPLYPGRRNTELSSLEWFEQYWQPLVAARRAGQRELRETDPRLFSALRQWLERRGRRIWELVPPLPGK